MNPVTRPGRARRHPFAIALAALATIAVLVAACGGASATPAPSLGPIELDGTSWRLLKYLTPDGTAYTVPASVTPGATFTGGQIQAAGGCNTASGPYTLDGTAISIGPLASTRMACDGPIMVVEGAYYAALEAVDTATGNGSTLLLREAAGFTALEFVRAN